MQIYVWILEGFSQSYFPLCFRITLLDPGRASQRFRPGSFSIAIGSPRGEGLISIKDGKICVCATPAFGGAELVSSMDTAVIRPFNRKLLPERLGHEVIDSDHMEISNWWFRVVNCVPIQFPFLIARMKRLMEQHFARETDIMKYFGRTLCECHQKEHAALLRFCDSTAKLSQYDWTQAQLMLRRDFPKDIREHIICRDQLLVLCVNTNGEIATCGRPR